MASTTETAELRNIILNFRVSELQVLLGFAGRNKSGKKQELQARALDLLRIRSNPIILKIRELQRRSAGRYSELDTVVRPPPVVPAPVPSLDVNTSVPPSVSSHSQGVSQSRICAVPPMKRDDPPQSQQNMSFYQRQAAAALGAGLYTLPLAAQVASQMSPSVLNQYPVHPDVRLKPLPFYDQMAEILRPSSLQPNISTAQTAQRTREAEFAFHMTPAQVHMLLMSKDYKPGEAAVQLQLRFCALDSSCPQDDAFPPGLGVKVNNRFLTLPNAIPTNKPGVEPKRPPKPLNITVLCHTNTNLPNKLHITWNHEYGRAFVCAVYLVTRLNSEALLERLKSRGKVSADHTRKMIQKKLAPENDDDICTTSLKVTLVCPLGQCRIKIPCRPMTCSHVNCFDASFYLMMNEKKPTWICPVCNRNITFDDLYVDGLFNEICAQAPADCREVEFKQDGSWLPIIEQEEKGNKRSAASDSDDSEDEREAKKAKQGEKEQVIDLTESTDEEDNVPRPIIQPPLSNSSRSVSSRPTPSSSSSQSARIPVVQTQRGGIQYSSGVSPSPISQNPLTSSRAPIIPPVVPTGRSPSVWPPTSSSSYTGSSAANPPPYYTPSSAFSSQDYFNQAAAVAAATPQSLYNAYGGVSGYDIYQLLVDDRSAQLGALSRQSSGSTPRDVINLD